MGLTSTSSTISRRRVTRCLWYGVCASSENTRQSVHSQVQHVMVGCTNFALLLHCGPLKKVSAKCLTVPPTCTPLDCNVASKNDPHSVTVAGFRGSGAIGFSLRLRNLPGLRRRGRWSTERTLERYVQEGVYYLQAASVPGPPPLLHSLATLAPSFFAVTVALHSSSAG